MNSYKPYRGSRVKNAGRIIFSTILVVLLLALLAFSIYRYFFFDPQDEQQQHPNTVPQYDEMTEPVAPTESEGTSGDDVPGDDDRDAPDERGEQQELHALMLPFGTADGGNGQNGQNAENIVRRCIDGGYNMLTLEMKNADGYLGYKSENETAVSGGVSAQGDWAEQVCRLCAENNIKTAAKISVFADNEISSAFRSFAIKTGSGARWLDRGYKGWLNPYSDGTAEYIEAIVRELAAIGFDEIILDNFHFPYVGKTELINYGSGQQSKAECLESFASRLVTAADGTECRVSVILTPSASKNGAHDAAGQELSGLCEYFSRIYFEAGEDYFSEDGAGKYLNAEFAETHDSTEFVPIIKSANQGLLAGITEAVMVDAEG